MKVRSQSFPLSNVHLCHTHDEDLCMPVPISRNLVHDPFQSLCVAGALNGARATSISKLQMGCTQTYCHWDAVLLTYVFQISRLQTRTRLSIPARESITATNSVTGVKRETVCMGPLDPKASHCRATLEYDRFYAWDKDAMSPQQSCAAGSNCLTYTKRRPRSDQYPVLCP